jgi:hypothetical protein
MVREADALVELQVGADTVQATPEHPFWANGAWTDAGDLVKGDELLPHGHDHARGAGHAPHQANHYRLQR